MNDRNLDQLLDAWMDLGPTSAPDRVADAARLEAGSTRQTAIPMWWPPRRFPQMNTTSKVALATAAVVVAAIVGYNYLIAPNVGAPGLDEPTPTASVGPSPGQAVLPQGERPLEPGSYQLSPGFPVKITFDLPAGLRSCTNNSLEQQVCTDIGGNAGSPGLAFLIVDNIVADPCDPGDRLLDPAVGPSVDDLVAALAALPGFEATAAEDVTISGYSGKRLQLTAPADPGVDCGLSTWQVSGRVNGVGPGEVNDIRILDVNGTRVVITTAHFPDMAELLPRIEQIVDSIQIEAP